MNHLFKFNMESCFLSLYAPCHVFSVLNNQIKGYNYCFFVYVVCLGSFSISVYSLLNIKAPYNVFLYFTLVSYLILSALHYNTRVHIFPYERVCYSYGVSVFLPICSLAQMYRHIPDEVESVWV